MLREVFYTLFYEPTGFLLLLLAIGIHIFLSTRNNKNLGIIVPVVFSAITAFIFVIFPVYPTCNTPCSLPKIYVRYVLIFQIITLFLVFVWFICRKVKESDEVFWKNPLLLLVLAALIFQAVPTMCSAALYNHEIHSFWKNERSEQEQAREAAEYALDNCSESLQRIFYYANTKRENPFVTQPEELKADLEAVSEVIGIKAPDIYYSEHEEKLFIAIYKLYGYEDYGARPHFIGFIWKRLDGPISIIDSSFPFSAGANKY